ncbi:NADPH-dependent F420 reductase [Halovenus rubra]|uniref:NADPH-dependent F420 reductase n=2 Tax=Halovenus rubra TaxID=869890 RepID=A0ACC7E2A2_9EURY|nr:NADPH-dependent F420 reductase [Halovenus rubra]
MHVALLGGTGDIGEGLALRVGRDTDHDVTIGSRDAEKAQAVADDYTDALGTGNSFDGHANPDAAAKADIAICCVPAYHLTDTIEAVADDLGDAVLVSPAVGMKRDESGMHYNPPGVGSVTELAAKTAPSDTPVAGAFHNLAAGKLAALDADLNWDVPVVATDEAAREPVVSLVADIDGLRPLVAGDLSNAAEIESLTPLLINLAQHNDGMHDLGVHFE